MAFLTQSGTGTVRIMPGLADQIDDGPVVFPPLEMGNIQFCRLFPAQTATQEDPEQRSIALALERYSGQGTCQSALAWSAVSQLPSRTPRFFGPLTRRMPAARSGLSKPESAASYARRLTAASLPLIVPGAS